MMNQRWGRTAFAAALVAAMAAGCAKQDDLGTVKAGGQVTYKGQPVTGAVVTFVPQSGKGAAVAVSDGAGRFRLMTSATSGAVPGVYKVTVTKAREVATDSAAQAANDLEAKKKADMAGLKAAPDPASPPQSLLPEKYAAADKTPLTFEVQASGQNDFQLDLAD